jgi:hypothetical protein
MRNWRVRIEACSSHLLDCIAGLIDTRYGGQIRKRYLTELRTAHLQAP